MSNALDSSAAPFSTAQLEFLAVREAELEAIRERRNAQHFRRFRTRAVVGFTILLAGVGASFYTQGKDSDEGRTAIVQSGRAVSVSGCNRDFVTTERFRNLLLRGQAAQKRALADGDITQRQYELGTKFYERELRLTPLPDCRESLEVVTDDPDAEIVVPEPLYPTPPTPTHGNP